MSDYNLGVVCVWPFWSNSDNMNADSNYAMLRKVLPKMVELTDERTIFLLMFPNPKYGADTWHYADDGLKDIPRVTLIPWNYDTKMATGVLSYFPDAVKELEKNYGVNIYWLHQVESGSQLYAGYQKSFTKICRPAIVAQHHYIIHKSLPYPLDAGLSRLMQQMVGTILSDRVILNSQHAHEMMMESFGLFLNEKTLKEIGEKSEVLRFGLIDQDTPIAPEADENTPITVIYNHRFETYKQPSLTFAMLDELRKQYQFEVWASQMVGQKSGAFRIDKSIYAPDRGEYLRRIAVPAINTINSTHETFCIAMLDSIACGHLVVVPRGITFEELLPPDYPYFFDAPGQQRDFMAYLMNHFAEEYNKWRIRLANHARQKFDLDGYARAYLDALQAEENVKRMNEKKDSTQENFDKFFAALPAGSVYTVNMLRKRLGSLSGLQEQSNPTRRVIRELLIYRKVKRFFVQTGEVCVEIA